MFGRRQVLCKFYFRYHTHQMIDRFAFDPQSASMYCKPKMSTLRPKILSIDNLLMKILPLADYLHKGSHPILCTS